MTTPGSTADGSTGDGYTGRTAVGDPPQLRLLPEAAIAKIAVGPMDNNAYLIRCRRTGAALLIDAAAEAPRLLPFLHTARTEATTWGGGTGLRHLLTTHRHADHWQALAELAAATGATTLAHALDAPHLPLPIDRLLGHEEVVTVGHLELTVIHLRGHTPGSVALRYDDPAGGSHLFTGDSLFPGGPGRTGGPAEFESLMTDLENRVFAPLADTTWIYPGHGWDTTLGAERPAIPQWRTRGW